MISDDDHWDGDMGVMGRDIPDWLQYCEQKAAYGESVIQRLLDMEIRYHLAELDMLVKQWVAEND